ncbi:MAG: cytochrome-c peroxidase [Candidatus Promineifilaceae bacterium]
MSSRLILIIIIFHVSTLYGAGSRREPILPLPQQQQLNMRLLELGDRLFHDKRLSRDNSLSCNGCHPLSRGGTDRLVKSMGVGGALGNIKAPTVYNSRFNFVQFWDGRADTLEEQAAGPVHNSQEMDSNWAEVVHKISADREMVEGFTALFDDGITGENIASAIAEFERSLVTPNSRFDRWLRGEDDSLSGVALKGYRLFKSYGCISCHQGVNVGGNLFAYMGAMGDYFKDRGTAITQADLGRFNVTGQEEDKHFFKVPSLRLAALNPPYFHDGSVQTLEEAVQVMGRYQLGREIPTNEVNAILVFLNSLVGENRRLKP